MRYPFMAAANQFMKVYTGIYAAGTMPELNRRYRKQAKAFEELYAKGKVTTTNPAKFTADDIMEYAKYLREKGLKPGSISHDMSSLSKLCLYASNNQCVEQARTRYPLLFRYARPGRGDVIERPQFDRIMEFSQRLNERSGLKRIRAYAEVAFALGTGPRSQELRHAKLANLDPELKWIFFDWVKGQGTYGQSRTVPIRPEIVPILSLWLKVRYPSESEYLFPNNLGGIITENTLTVDRMIVCRDVGFTFDIRKCRRTYGQYLVDEGYTVDKVAVILGHSSSRTTEYNYARPRNDRVATEIIEKWSCE